MDNLLVFKNVKLSASDGFFFSPKKRNAGDCDRVGIALCVLCPPNRTHSVDKTFPLINSTNTLL